MPNEESVADLKSEDANAQAMTERILVVDDEEPIRDVISSVLNAAGFNTRQACSSMEALAILGSAGEFQLMLFDLIMPEFDGIALLERAQEKYPDMPVIVVTAVHDITVALAAIRNGAYDYLLKPFEREQMLVMVRRAFEHRRLKLENRAYQSNLESLITARTEQLRQAMIDLERAYDLTLESLGDALALKSVEFEGYSKRVTAYSTAIARAMGLSGDKIRVIARGAFLHDIGKMAIPDHILRKPAALTVEETQIMREHCFRGYQLVKKFPFLAEASEIVYAHQEHYDGTGYPRGLKGKEIPLGARIVAVADALDAIISGRPHRAAQSIMVAREEIKRFAGTLLDPDIVQFSLKMPDTIWEDLRRVINSQTLHQLRINTEWGS
jgi:putative nucleotidyltransferase with HDIG domain